MAPLSRQESGVFLQLSFYQRHRAGLSAVLRGGKSVLQLRNTGSFGRLTVLLPIPTAAIKASNIFCLFYHLQINIEAIQIS